MIVVVTGVVMIMVMRFGGVLLFRLHARFVEHFLEFAFATLHVDRDTVVFGGVWCNAVAEVSSSVRAHNDIWLNQRKVGSAAALVGGGTAVARKTHRWVTIRKLGWQEPSKTA